MNMVGHIKHRRSFKIMKFWLFTCPLDLAVSLFGLGYRRWTGDPTQGTWRSFLEDEMGHRQFSTKVYRRLRINLKWERMVGALNLTNDGQLDIYECIGLELWHVRENLKITLL